MRTPKNYYYKPSAASEQKTYTLKSKRQNAISLSAVCRFSRDVYSSAPTFSSTEQDENRFVFYYQESNPRVVKIGVPASTWDESEKQYRHYIRESTEEEKATVAGFGLEYKVIPYNEKYLKTRDDGGKSVNGSFLEQEENEGTSVSIRKQKKWTNTCLTSTISASTAKMLTMGKSKDNSMKIYSVKDKEFNEFGKVVKII